MTIETPKPGIYFDVPFENYLQWDAISNSSMQPALRSMAHYRARVQIEETPAMRLGTLVHAGKFEPALVAERFAVMPAYELTVRTKTGEIPASPKSTAAYRELCDGFRRDNLGKSIVTQSEFDAMARMVNALAQDADATECLTGGKHEVSIIAKGPVTGLMCKGRIDHLKFRKAKPYRIGDLKTTADAWQFENVIADRAYYRQLPFYGDMLSWLDDDVEIEQFDIVAIETSDPFATRCAALSEEAIELGRVEYRRLLDQIAECRKTNVWPGYPKRNLWHLPHWATKGKQAN